MAASAQLHRELNAEQVKNRMVACLLRGHWPFPVPVGYIRTKGQRLNPDEPVSSVIREAFEGYASGRFASLQAVLPFLNDCPDFPIRRNSVIGDRPDLQKQ